MATTNVGQAATGDQTRVYNSGGINNRMSVAFANADGNIKSIDVGFVPRAVWVINETDNIQWAKHHLHAAANCVKQTASAQTIDTSSNITITAEGSGKCNVTLSATVVPAGKNVVVMIEGD